MPNRHALFIVALVAVSLVGCRGDDAPKVVVYTALDRGFSEPIFQAFTTETGIAVDAVYDTESTKSVGLATRIRAETARPRCDVFWNNEILNTIGLKSAGLLEAYSPRDAASFPAGYRDPAGFWHGFAARARVLIVNTELVPDGPFPSSIDDLADSRYAGKTGIAKPLFGTTASHAACLVLHRGEDGATAFFDRLKANEVQIHGGNKGCARAVADGRCAFALTDTDDAIIELEAGKPVRIVYPDAAANGAGTLFLPNTLALVAGAPHPEEARKLADWLLTKEVEEMLAACASAQIPLHPQAKPSDRVKGPGSVKAMKVDFEQAAAVFDTARKLVEKRFLE